MADDVEVTGVGARSPHNEGLYEAGKALMVESVQVGRDFCKSMIGVATGAIPIYIALVGLAAGKDFRPSAGEGAVLTLAPLALLCSATAFAVGYFPKRTTYSLDIPAEIDAARTATLGKRMLWASIGFGLLVVGIALAVAGIFYGLSLEAP
jgi:hypothetical protein